MRYIIYGAGAVGSAIGAGLFEAGLSVTLIARGRHLDQLASDALHYDFLGRRRRLAIPAAGSPAGAEIAAGDVVFLCIKSQDTLEALKDLARSTAVPIRV